MKHPSRYRRVMWRITFFSFSAALLIGVALLSMYLPPADPATIDVTVPDLVGQIYDAGQPPVEADYFSVRIEYRTDTDTPPDTILSQSPDAGSTRRVIIGKRPCCLPVFPRWKYPTSSACKRTPPSGSCARWGFR